MKTGLSVAAARNWQVWEHLDTCNDVDQQLCCVQQKQEKELTFEGISWNGRPRPRRNHTQPLLSPFLNRPSSCVLYAGMYINALKAGR